MPDEVRVEAAKRYVEIYELITGKTFVPDESADPQARIAANLGLAS
jgi:phosphoribosylaminoimidazole-succinocarboxamide synthase